MEPVGPSIAFHRVEADLAIASDAKRRDTRACLVGYVLRDFDLAATVEIFRYVGGANVVPIFVSMSASLARQRIRWVDIGLANRLALELA